MSLINSLRSGVGWISRRNVTARELIKSANAHRLSVLSTRRNAEFAKSHPDDSIDIAYCSSVFTHLTDDLCRQWVAELARVVRPGGLIAFTTAGMSFAYRYHESEKDDYLRGIPIYRDWDEVGRRDFFAWHPPQYVRRVLCRGSRRSNTLRAKIQV